MGDSDIDLLNHAPCGILSFTNDGVISSINCNLLNQLGYQASELIGQNVEKIFTLSSRIFYQTHLFPLLKLNGKADEIFFTLLGKNREHVPVLLNAKQHSKEEQTTNIFACITVYQRKKYEEEILQARRTAEEALNSNEKLLKMQHDLEISNQELDKQLTELKYKSNELIDLNHLLAHDLQEPIRKISLFADIFSKSKEKIDVKRLTSTSESISNSARKLQNLMKNLQEYMYISTLDLNKEPVNLEKIIKEQATRVSGEFPDIPYSLSISDLPHIKADLTQLQILFHQLLQNSFQFRSGERKLQINISGSIVQQNFYNSIEGKYRYVDHLSIVVEDNGIGFNVEYKDLIFKLLKKLALDRPGYGFGLAICKRITENHRGTITGSGIENKGAKFTVTLPFE